MTTRAIHKSRGYAGESDLLPICELLNRVDAADDLDDNYAVDDLRLEFDDPDLDKDRNLRLWEDAEGRLVGFGQLWIPREGDLLDGGFYWRVAPEARDEGLEDDMFAWAEGRMRETRAERGKPVELRCWTRDHYAYARRQIESRGFEAVRYFFRMERPLSEPIPEPQLPEGFTLRHTNGAADAEAWVETFNQSFVDHYNFHANSVEKHKHWLESPKYNPERDLVAVAPDGTFASFCFCWVDQEANERNKRSEGWIDMLGTRRGFRKIGLGRAMLLAGLHRLKSEGLETAMLGVDAENPTGALRLYESAGFRTRNTTVAYRRDVD